jgi:uncharacterized protein YcbK (DUF882 family)
MTILPSAPLLFVVAFTLALGSHAPANALAGTRVGSEPGFDAAWREARIDSWAAKLAPIEVRGPGSSGAAMLRLYASTGEVDETARAEFERFATSDSGKCQAAHCVAVDREPHVLAVRLEQLVFKAAYRFQGARVDVVSGWRQRAGRHTAGEALDFKLQGVSAATLAAYLRGLPRVGVGVYTHPRTQFVHLDVRDPSYHWIDASPPGIRWRERQLRDPGAAKRDEGWAPFDDLPEQEQGVSVR